MISAAERSAGLWLHTKPTALNINEHERHNLQVIGETHLASHGPLLKSWFNFLSYKTYRWDVSFDFCEHSCEFKYATFYAQYTCLKILPCLFVVLRMAVFNELWVLFHGFLCFGWCKIWEKCFIVTLNNYLENFSVIVKIENCRQSGHNDLEALFLFPTKRNSLSVPQKDKHHSNFE